MTRRYQVEFSRVPIGATFAKNGNACEKRSTRTAHVAEYGRTFYFGRRELVTVGQEVAETITAQERAA